MVSSLLLSFGLILSRGRGAVRSLSAPGGRLMFGATSWPPTRTQPQGADMTDKGLEEVVAASTRLSDVDGKAGRLWYAGYTIEDLATRATFEEVVHLLQYLRLPTEAELDELNERLVAEREISPF